MAGLAMRRRWVLGVAQVLALALVAGCRAVPRGAVAWEGVDGYIAKSWDALTRTALDRGALVDPKVPQGQSILYVPAEEGVTEGMRAAAGKWGVKVETLPAGTRVGVQVQALERQGLLYLPHAYVVPGGRFNEMYGWDSYFIVEGLMESGRVELARGMTENFFYELDHYGAVLNANRTYYLTRSQPPFLTSMVLAVDRGLQQKERRAWIERGYEAAVKDWTFWNRPEMRAGETGLARYFDYGQGPVPEMQDDASYYQNVAAKLAGMGEEGRAFLQEAGPEAMPRVEAGGKAWTLTPDFYVGDRAMRASGFDVSFRFGPYGGATHHFAPVCLNSLLYKEEMDLAGMAERLGKGAEAAMWRGRAARRQRAMTQFLWDEGRGMFMDYDFVAGKRSEYAYVTTFYPLWAGAATEEQARRVAGNLGMFLRAGGVAMSARVTGVQWDMPFGWAPVELLTVEGLRRYGFRRAADDVSQRWLGMIRENFAREGTLREKYDVVTRSSEVNVQVGYSANVVGFGWTNGVYLKLEHGLARR